VKGRARRRWNQLEGDPELAGPWKHLFRQVQSPRHVLSELLQNADDVEASRVRVSLVNGQFVFEHNGKDFREDDFASLCSFGFSNKRKLHTIGFRGIGFKSTFSLGEAVEVLTPSLAVRFEKRRFTEPVWIDDAPPCEVTRIVARVQDPNREKELRKNLQEWVKSTASLLFFNNVNELTIDDVTLHKQRIGPGPVPSCERIRLVGHTQHDVLLFVSPEEPFPLEVVDEIRQERDVDDLHLPPCRVEVVVDLPGSQRLYVVLPSGVTLKAPFSCNAPFLQDPARSAIKAPSLSPTNRWLLHRVGTLLGDAMLSWLQNHSLKSEDRAKAYCLLPDKPDENDSLESDVMQTICQGFVKAVGNKPILLATTGDLVHSKGCMAPPKRAYAMWTPAQLLKVYGNRATHVLAEGVTDEHRRRLKSWDWLDVLDEQGLIERLAGGRSIPRPAENKNVLALWSLVQQSVRYDYGGEQRRRLAIVPVDGSDVLLPAKDVVRLPRKKEAIPDEAWQFLRGLLRVVDPEWCRFLDELKNTQNREELGALQLLKDIRLDHASDTDVIVDHACRSLFSRQNVSLEDHVCIAHLMAALDAKAPEEFRCVTRDGQQRNVGDGIIAPQDPAVEELLPDDWAAAHVLHDAYFRGYSTCTRQQWEQWARSKESRFRPFAPIRARQQSIGSKGKLADFLKSRHVALPTFFPYNSDHFAIKDHDFDKVLVDFWAGKKDSRIWAKVTECVLPAPAWYWQDYQSATVSQIAKNGSQRDVDTDPIPAAWIVRLRGLACLPDTYGVLHNPAELYLRTPDTEPLLGVEPFVRAELDTETTKPLLQLLGVRDTPAGLDKLLGRIRDLAKAPDFKPLLSEILKWYGALDRALSRCDGAGIKQACQAFGNESLVLTAESQWAKASEVFLRPSDEFPDAPVVHPAANNLGMWVRLGMADRPTADLVLSWLKKLPSGERLEQSAIHRVRAALQRYPDQIWLTCRHWLALDNSWMPVEELRFRLTMHSPTKWSELFPAVKAASANLQMLDTETCDRQPFVTLLDLGTAVEYRLTRRPNASGDPVPPPWLVALSRLLLRAKVSDEAQTQRIREAAARLARSDWLLFDDQDSLQVTPYVNGAPAGQPHACDVLWHERSIFVRNGRLARSFDALVAELARPFANEKVTEAMKACIERAPDFITEYMEEHFTLEAETALPPDGSESTTEVGKDEVEDKVGKGGEKTPVTAEEGQEGVLPESTDTHKEHEVYEEGDGRHRRKREPSLFERFALGSGYSWDDIRQRFVHPDGSWIERCETPFHWRRFDAAGNAVTRYWASQHCLAQGGVEIAAELWELFRRSPLTCSMILVDREGRPWELPGPDLLRMVEDKVITLYPAKYRIRKESNA